MSNPFINLRKFVPLLSLTLVLVCFGFSLNAPGATFAPTEEERVAATEQGFNGELKLAALPRKIDPEGRTYVEVDDMLFWVREGAGVESAFTGNRWTNGIVYYVFDAAVSSTNRQNWRNAAAAWSAVAPLPFTEKVLASATTSTFKTYSRSNASTDWISLSNALTVVSLPARQSPCIL